MRTSVLLCAVLLAPWLAAAESPLRFHEPFDRAPAGGALVAGKIGKAVVPPAAGIRVAAAGRLDKRRGTLCLWIQPRWDGSKYVNHGFLADEIDFSRIGGNNLYLWHWCVGQLRFDVRDPKDRCVTFGVKHWKAGEWHHVAAAWDCTRGLWLFADGRLVAHRKATWEPRQAAHFRVGANWAGRAPADAALDDLRIYNRVLDAAQVARVMQGRRLPVVEYKGLAAPARVVEGKPFAVRLDLRETGDLGADARMAVSLDGFELGTFPAGRAASAVVPRYLHLASGPHKLRAKIAGALSATAAPEREVTLAALARPPRPTWTEAGGTVRLNGTPLVEDGAGLLVENVFYTGDAARAKARELLRSGGIADALPCRRLDEVDCTTTSHGFSETSPSRLVQLAPGKTFRIPGPPEAVTQTRRIYGRDRKVLPAFSYRLRTMPRPTPHLLVVESVNDAERNIEIAVDTAPGRRPSPALAATGPGSGRLINLAVVCTAREFPADGKPFRQAFLFYPKSDAVEVTVCSSGRELKKAKAPGSAVARMAIYEIARPLAELANPVEPPAAAARHLALFYPEVMLSFREYGFSGATAAQRRSSVRSMCDTLRFLGFDRLEFHPYPFSRKAHFRSAVYKQTGEHDVFDDILPIAQKAGIAVVPRMDSLCFYGDVWKDEPINYQLTKDGKTPSVFGKCPDPLRPPVQKLLLDMLGDMLERCKGHACVPGVGFRANAKFGVLYVGGRHLSTPPQENGYSRWDIEAFARDTATRVPAAHDDPGACYKWLKANAWEKWIDWRCRKMRQWWLQARDLARRHGKQLFVRTVIPYTHHHESEKTQWYGHKVPPLTLCRNHGFDPRLFHQDTGLLISEYFALGADRYNRGRIHNRAWWHDPRLDGLLRTAEGGEVALYSVYWELPTPPEAFRVGPAHMAGCAALEPLTYALRTRDAYGLIFYNWHRATTGIGVGLRQFARAYRALPAVEPRPFDGQCDPAPDERLWIRWFGGRLAVLNDSPKPCTVKLTIPGRKGNHVFDLATCRTVGKRSAAGDPLRCTLDLRAYDLRTLEVR